jgi:hypothetical protein
MSHGLLNILLVGAAVVPITPFAAIVLMLCRRAYRRRQAIRRITNY